MNGKIDLRSDTITLPTEEMREAMARAEVGDDGRGEDPTVRRLEEMSAERLGKEAGLFVASGTMGNLVSVLSHTMPGEEIITEHQAHVYLYELGGLAALGGLMCNRVTGVRGVLRAEDVEAAIRPPGSLFPRTALICLENTHNIAGGAVATGEDMASVKAVADRYGIPVHLDGARIWNAAVRLGAEASDLARHATSVTFCLSKGLSAPVGSVVVGERKFIETARRKRRLLGGGMRQAGVVAAAGIVALLRMVTRLAVDHENARILAEGIQAVPGIRVDMAAVQTNMVMVDLGGSSATPQGFLEHLSVRNVLALPVSRTAVRFVTHRHIERADVLEAAEAVRAVAEELCA
ncbi:MAG: hypothetical protein HYY08_01850 [Firmicutes bacterium]|nr:hypothetical protein [Bacillota bacterium]